MCRGNGGNRQALASLWRRDPWVLSFKFENQREPVRAPQRDPRRRGRLLSAATRAGAPGRRRAFLPKLPLCRRGRGPGAAACVPRGERSRGSPQRAGGRRRDCISPGAVRGTRRVRKAGVRVSGARPPPPHPAARGSFRKRQKTPRKAAFSFKNKKSSKGLETLES